MHPILNIAISAAREAGIYIARAGNRIDTLTVINKQKHDFVSEVDINAEQIIIQHIQKAYPSHGIIAEESGIIEGDEYQWIIDPLDGTTNFLHNIPQYAVSIAVMKKDILQHSVIYNPVSEELFYASAGDGAYLNNKRIRVSKNNELDKALIGTGFPYRSDQNIDAYLPSLKNFMAKTAGIRRPGSAALDLAWVSCGRFDGFYEMGLHIWDIAAGVLLIKEAGGMVGDLKGGKTYLKTGNILAGNPYIFHKMILEFKKCQL
ncbi:MAG: inositol monophosphatase [Gammaproteobacteria bacterium]|nr:MAG: inositol monophosphatase [Gammaproteobacteria bacterium]